MKGLKQFGAMAMAAALTITMVAPITARADYQDKNYDQQENTYYDVDYKGAYDADGDFQRTSEIITNKVTGDTATYDYTTKKWNGDPDKAQKDYFGNPKKLQVGVKSNFKLTLTANPGESFDGKIKFKSGKANVSIKKVGTYERDVMPGYDSATKQYYFLKDDGSKEYVGDNSSKRTKYSYTYILEGKKPGEAKLQYKINGKKYKIKVTVTNEARPFATVSFAGKSYQMDYNAGATNSNYYAKQSTNKAGNFYTNKKKGKFRVTMNKNYKFIATYVIKDTDYETKTDEDGSYIERKSVKGIDLNGDGDFEDTIDGIEEDSFSDKTFVKYKKKNAKIKLNTSFDEIKTNAAWKVGDDTLKINRTYKGNLAQTEVIVVYQNKLTKAYGMKRFNITYKKNIK